MRVLSARLWAMAIFSGVLQVLAFPIAGPLPLWRTLFCWVALVPLLAGLIERSEAGRPIELRQAALMGYICGFVWYMGNCCWIYRTMYLYGGLPKPISLGILVLFSMYLGIYHGLFALLLGVLRRSGLGAGGTLSLAPAVWVAVELARARITGFPWDLLGNSLVDNLLVTRIAPAAGVMGISFLVASINVGLAIFFVGNGRRRYLFSGATLVVAAGLALGGGLARTKTGDNKAAETAVLMQENLEVGAIGREIVPLSVAQEIEIFSRDSLNPEVASKAGDSFTWALATKQVNPTVIVWPEAPSRLRSDDLIFRAKMAALAQVSNAAVIAGSLGVDFDKAANRGYFLYDSASLFDRTGTYDGRYDKIHLVPWGEYIPFKRFFSFAEKLTEGAGDMDRGSQRTVFRTGGHSYGVFVCYESIFGDEVRQFAKNGAEVLVNISDDGWYGDTGAPWQHLNMARMRAIENRRWVLRSTNTGVTTAIDPLGRVTLEAPRHVRGAYAFGFDFAQGQTFYTLHGDWFAYLCALVTLLSVISSVMLKRKGAV